MKTLNEMKAAMMTAEEMNLVTGGSAELVSAINPDMLDVDEFLWGFGPFRIGTHFGRLAAGNYYRWFDSNYQIIV